MFINILFQIQMYFMFSKLHNIYWFIRITRDRTKKRKYYRQASKEKKRLLEAGVDKEEIRLLCRHLSNLRNAHAEKRLEDYRSKLESCR